MAEAFGGRFLMLLKSFFDINLSRKRSFASASLSVASVISSFCISSLESSRYVFSSDNWRWASFI